MDRPRNHPADDNRLFECDRCQTIIERQDVLATVACPNCGHNEITQILLTVVCDFCGEKENVRWGIPCEDFEEPWLPGAPHSMSRGGWACCDDCKPFVENEDVAGLVQRCLEMEDMADSEPMRALVTKLHRAFFAHRTGPIVPSEEVQ